MKLNLILNLIVVVGILQTCIAKGFYENKLSDGEKRKYLFWYIKNIIRNANIYLKIICKT